MRKLTKPAALKLLTQNCNELGFPPEVTIDRKTKQLRLCLNADGPTLVIPIDQIQLLQAPR